MKSFCLLFISFGLSITFSLEAQNRVVNGRVFTLDSLPVANFTVVAQKSGAAITTDSLGYFNIVTLNKDVLFFEGKVFRNKKVRVTPKLDDTLVVKVHFKMTEENEKLAIGYGYVSKDNLTSAIGHLDRRQQDFCSYNNVFDLIKGRFPGVQVTAGGGEPIVIIRGVSSLTLSSCALYVVDGMVVGSIGSISPCQIKDIYVIKDSAASIYGSRGANGVILITTKNGEE